MEALATAPTNARDVAKQPENFWDEFHELREDSERKLISNCESALHDSPKVVADMLRAWMKSDKEKPGNKG